MEIWIWEYETGNHTHVFILMSTIKVPILIHSLILQPFFQPHGDTVPEVKPYCNLQLLADKITINILNCFNLNDIWLEK